MHAEHVTCGSSLKVSEDLHSSKEGHAPKTGIKWQSDSPREDSVESINEKQKVMQNQGPCGSMLEQYLL